jgi:hypothetical protein
MKATKPEPKPEVEKLTALKDCAAKRKRIECAKDNITALVFAARATSNLHRINFKVL